MLWGFYGQRKKKVPYSLYVFVSSNILVFAIFFFNWLRSDIGIHDSFFIRNIMSISIIVEIIILTMVLTLRFKTYKLNAESLLKKTNEQQEQIFKTISDYQQKEMQRFSSLLHDSVGAKLSAMRLNLETIQNNHNGVPVHEHLKQSINDISDLANDVRRFSHNLSPVLLQNKGLVNSMEDFIQNINRTSTLHIQFESIGSLQTVSFRYELMVYNILQELIQNIIKHSGATEAIIQLILEKEIISILVEDNGKGLVENEHNDGLGFFQIKQLIIFVKGRLEIKSPLNSGCRVSIEFPVLEYESAHPAPYS